MLKSSPLFNNSIILMLMLMSFKKLLQIVVLPCLLLIAQQSFAQERTVTGKVTDSKDGSPIAGASVIPKGTTKGTSTGADGTYKISVGSNVTTLVITSVGFGRMEVDISGGKTTADASLAASADNLGEVIVSTGYGTRKVKDATGSVAAITTKDFNKGVISTPEQLIQGRTPGVIVTPSSGEPGAAATINIRGSASIRGNNDPLFVVDGVPLDPGGTTGTASGVEGSSTPKNPLMFLNPNDIESISILKDASSAAIYGSRGANGVIIITTKSGKGRTGAFSFNASTSLSTTASRYDLMDAQSFLIAAKKANMDGGASDSVASEAIKAVDKGAGTDWQDEIFQTAISQNYNLSWGFSNKGSALRLSGSYDNQEGIVKTSELKRLTGRVNYSQKFYRDKFKLDFTSTYSNVKNRYPPNTNNAGYQGSLIGATISFNPTYPIYKADGSFFDPSDGNRNPVEMLNYFDDRDNINRFLNNISLSWEIIKGLVYKGTFGYDKSSSLRKSFADPRLSSGSFGGNNNVNGRDLGNGIAGNGRAVYQDLDLSTLLVEHTITYDKIFKNDHVINAVAGYSYQRYKNEYAARVAWGLSTPVVNPSDVFVKDIDNFTKHDQFIPYFSKEELQSFFGRVNYIIADKYFLTGTFRADGSSKFGENNRYGFFPAFAVKWRILKEDFASGLTDVFNELSIRVNWGKLGSQDGLPPYKSLPVRQIYQGSSQIDTSVVNEANPDLKWEEATTTGAGLDFAMFNNRLSGTVDFYYTNRKNLLFLKANAGGFGAATNIWLNLPGVVKNKGLEVSLNFQAIPKKRKFGWDINYNMTFLKNRMTNFDEIVNTGGVNGQGLTGAYAQTIQEGYSLFTWKMPVFLGYDGNGNTRLAFDGSDQFVGSALPKFTAGLTNNFSLNRWNLSIFLNASTGFYVYNNTANALFLKGSVKTAHNATYEAGFSPENPFNIGSVSTRFLEKGDFLRLSNVNVSYLFALRNNKVIKSLSMFASGQNLALWTDYSGLDPEVNVDHNLGGVPSRGFDYAGYPKARTFTVGINMGF
jgi:TonB-linked SusC/RagA family outer membrane protein